MFVAVESLFFGWIGVQLLTGTLDAGLVVPIAVFADVSWRPNDPDWCGSTPR